MNPIDHDLHDDAELDERLRRTLAAVAATVDDQPSPLTKPRRSHRRLAIAAGATLAALPLAAGAWVQFGPEYVDRIPPANPIISGSLDGERYWVVDGREDPRCEGSPSGIELIVEENNLVGQEWNTTGALFGTVDRNGCTTGGGEPADTYFHDGGVSVAGGMLWMGALHEDVDEVRLTLGEADPVDVATFEHEGDTYYLVEIPPGTGRDFSIEYLVDGQVVPAAPGETEEHVVPHE